jgi:methyl-accepting chemotaxis protein/methyl-accepting chemotaxis protein-1 (serine sensor receptor)
MESKMTLGAKLFTGVGSMLGLSILASTLGLVSMASLRERFDRAVVETTRKIELAGALNKAESEMFSDQRAVLLYSFAKDPAGVQRFSKEFDTDAVGLRASIDALRPLLQTEQGRQLLEKIEGGLKTWLSTYQEIRSQADSGNAAGALYISRDKVLPIHAELDQASRELVEQQRGFLASDREATGESYVVQRWLALITLVLSLLAAAGMVRIVRSVTGKLKDVGGGIAEGAGQVSGAAAQIAASSQSLAQGASQQAASLEQTSASTEEITSMTRKNAENSQNVARLMAETAGRVEGANRALDEMVGSMKEIDASSDKVAKIIKMIFAI